MPGQPRPRAPDQEPRPLERRGDGGAREQGRGRHRRPHLDLRLGGDALRGRLQPFLPRPATRVGRRRRRHLLPGARGAGHLRPRLPRRAHRREPPRELPPRAEGRRRPVVLSASVADAGLLGVSDRLDGPRPDHGHLPGAVHPLPRRPRPEARRRPARSGRSSATARPTSPNRSAPSRWPAREKLDNLIFVINCNLQRLDGPVRGNGQIIQELEAAFRGAGWNVIKVDLGPRVGSAAGQGPRRPAREAHGRDRRRPVPEVRRRSAAPTSASTSGAPIRGCSTWSSTCRTTS